MNEQRVTIRPACSDDIDLIHNIEEKTFSDAWSRESFVNEIESNEMAHYYVAQIDENLVGYVGYWKILDQAHITNVAVLDEYRGRGIAKSLLRRIFEDIENEKIESFTLECRVSNTPAINLYESFGFKSWGIRPKYYIDNNEDAVIMWLESEEIKKC